MATVLKIQATNSWSSLAANRSRSTIRSRATKKPKTRKNPTRLRRNPKQVFLPKNFGGCRRNTCGSDDLTPNSGKRSFLLRGEKIHGLLNRFNGNSMRLHQMWTQLWMAALIPDERWLVLASSMFFCQIKTQQALSGTPDGATLKSMFFSIFWLDL